MDIEKLKTAIKNNRSLNSVIHELGLNNGSYTYSKINKLISENSIDTSHLLSRSDVGKKIHKKYIIDKEPRYGVSDLSIESKVSRSVIKRIVIKEKLIPYECKFCLNDGNWMGKKFSLILDRINGVRDDNRLENLRFLCPNCNSTLDTHCVGYKHKKGQPRKFKIENFVKRRKVERPSIEDLNKSIEEVGFLQTGKKYNVSDNCIRKWIKFYDKYKTQT